MTDLITRLRTWSHARHAAPASDLMDEAASEIERLRADWPEQLQAHSVLIAEQELEIKRLRLTAEEREAVAYYLGTGGPYNVDRTLVALLSRTGSDGEKTGDESAGCLDQAGEVPERERVADILADYYEWRSQQEDRIGTHSDRCHVWPRHERCMIHRLAAEVERLRQVLLQGDAGCKDRGSRF